MTDDIEQPARTGMSLGAKVVAWVVGLSVTVFVLFTWVFPYITEIGLSPTLEG